MPQRMAVFNTGGFDKSELAPAVANRLCLSSFSTGVRFRSRLQHKGFSGTTVAGRMIALVALSLSANWALFSASLPVIGIVSSEAPVTINGSRVSGNATLFEGDVLEPGTACEVQLSDGRRVRLAGGSRSHLFAGHFDLEKGSGRTFGYTANALGLTVRMELAATGTVSVVGKTVEVTALTGDLHVYGRAGAGVANLVAGQFISLEPGSAEKNSAYSLTGCAVNAGKQSLLTDQTTSITVELRGAKIPVGKVIHITGAGISGTQPVGGAAEVVGVQTLEEIPGGSCQSVAPAAAGVAAGAAGAVAANTIGASVAAAGVGAVGVPAAAAATVVAGVAAATVHSAGTAAVVAIPTPVCTSPCLLH